MKQLFIFLFLFSLSAFCQAQIHWYNPADFPEVIQNQGWPGELAGRYHRFPERAKNDLSPKVWQLSRNSAGLAIHFYSNSPFIQVRYQVEGNHAMQHMPATGVSGIDLYAYGENGELYWCAGQRAFRDTICYSYDPLSYHTRHPQGYEYHLYLPLYNTVKWLEIGVTSNSFFRFLPQRLEKPIVVYGTSIAQGACASRPGMAWSNILERHLDLPVLNFGFSGNGKLEKNVLSFINENDACLYILDCLPNLTNEPEEKIKTLLTEAVYQIREKHPEVPILLAEHDGYGNGQTNSSQYDAYTKANQACLQAYLQLQEKHVPALFYLSCEELNINADAQVDGVHPSDAGMKKYADAYENKIRKILNMPEGPFSTTRAIPQRREAPGYEWKERHRTILALQQTTFPKTLLIGNSITHYWGGVPAAQYKRGESSWKLYMDPAHTHNLGFGWDRIENMLWRIYHGELEGFRAQKVILLAGTNNLESNTDQEILAGIEFLIQAIRIRQPQAQVKVCGILPRRNQEKRIHRLNQGIRGIAHRQHISFGDPGRLLLNPQHTINENLFLDGLHPNAEGYRKIAEEIMQ